MDCQHWFKTIHHLEQLLFFYQQSYKRINNPLFV
jgi:hypothetical protein